jgi:hypothetical protein
MFDRNQSFPFLFLPKGSHPNAPSPFFSSFFFLPAPLELLSETVLLGETGMPPDTGVSWVTTASGGCGGIAGLSIDN